MIKFMLDAGKMPDICQSGSGMSFFFFFLKASVSELAALLSVDLRANPTRPQVQDI